MRRRAAAWGGKERDGREMHRNARQMQKSENRRRCGRGAAVQIGGYAVGFATWLLIDLIYLLEDAIAQNDGHLQGNTTDKERGGAKYEEKRGGEEEKRREKEEKGRGLSAQDRIGS